MFGLDFLAELRIERRKDSELESVGI